MKHRARFRLTRAKSRNASFDSFLPYRRAEMKNGFTGYYLYSRASAPAYSYRIYTPGNAARPFRSFFFFFPFFNLSFRALERRARSQLLRISVCAYCPRIVKDFRKRMQRLQPWNIFHGWNMRRRTYNRDKYKVAGFFSWRDNQG